MRLHRFGAGRPRVLALHGFAQQGGHFAEIAPYVGAPMVAPDLPGHGPEPHLPATMDEAVDRVVELIDETGASVLLGYSMGGRVGLRAALHRSLELLVLVSVSAGIRDDLARAERAKADSALADRMEAEGLESFLDEWEARPMFAGRGRRSAAWQAKDRGLRVANTAAGLAASLRGMGQGVSAPVADGDLARLQTPTVLLAGGLDAAYTAEAERLAARLPAGSYSVNPSVGHAIVDEDPGWVAMAVRRGL